jgi:uncharacterized protein (TIRG00374 family)
MFKLANKIGKKATRKWVQIVVPVAILAAFIAFSDVAQIGSALLAIPTGILLGALAVATIDRIMMGFKWRQLIIATGARFGILAALRIQYQTNVCGRIIPIPLAADLYRAYLANRVRVPWSIAASSIVLEKVLAMLVAMCLALTGLFVLAGEWPAEVEWWILFAAVGAGLMGGVSVLTLLLFAPAHKWIERLIRKISRWEKVSDQLDEIYRKMSTAMLYYRERHWALAVHGLLGVGEFGLQLVKLVILAYGVGIEVPPLMLSAILSVVLVVRRVAALLESWSVGEGAAVLTATLVGIDLELAVALFVANFAVSTVAILPGIVFYWTHAEDHLPEIHPEDRRDDGNSEKPSPLFSEEMGLSR